jgi:serine/threonine protein kinase
MCICFTDFVLCRAPEVIIGHPYDTRIDIWSVGAVLAELHTGYVFFQNDSVPTMLSRITGILGPFPQHVLQNGKDTGKYFSLSNIVYERDEEGSFHLIFPKRTDLASRLHVIPSHRNDALPKPSLDDELFVDFVRQMLHLDPAVRMSATEALAHPWLQDADSIYVSEYIIGQNPGPGAGQYGPQPPEDDDEEEEEYEEGDEEDDDEEGEGSEYEDEDDEEEEGSEYEDVDDEQEMMDAQADQAARQYMLALQEYQQHAASLANLQQQLEEEEEGGGVDPDDEAAGTHSGSGPDEEGRMLGADED